MKQKMTVIIISVTLAMFLISGGFGEWKDRLQIGVSLTTAAGLEEAKDAISQNPIPSQQKPTAEAEEPCAETEDPTAEAEDPTAETEYPTAGTEDPTAEVEDPSLATEKPGDESGAPSQGVENESASGADGSGIGAVSE